MRPECDTRCRIGWGALAAMLALSGGCASLGGLHPAQDASGVGPTIDRDTQIAVLMADTIQTLQRLAASNPAEQAEIVSNARNAYERSPGGGAQLRYALTLATQGHVGRDAEHARRLLRELAAQPESLAPVEHALTLFELAQLDRELGLVGDNERLQASLAHNADQDRLAASNRRLQSALDENTRLRHQVEELQAKLDAVANIERNLTERKANTEGHNQ